MKKKLHSIVKMHFPGDRCTDAPVCVSHITQTQTATNHIRLKQPKTLGPCKNSTRVFTESAKLNTENKKI